MKIRKKNKYYFSIGYLINKRDFPKDNIVTKDMIDFFLKEIDIKKEKIFHHNKVYDKIVMFSNGTLFKTAFYLLISSNKMIKINNDKSYEEMEDSRINSFVKFYYLNVEQE